MSFSQIDPHADDYYSRLGLSADANKSEIRKAGKKATKRFHPDSSESSDTEELHDRIRKAKSTLRKEQTREEYDVFYSRLNPSDATEEYEKWEKKAKPATPEYWIESKHDPDESSNKNKKTPDSTSSSDTSGSTNHEDLDIEIFDNNKSSSEWEQNKFNQQSDDSNSRQESDNVHNIGLDRGDMWYISEVLNDPIIADGSGELSYDSHRNNIIIDQIFEHEVTIDLDTGEADVPDKKPPFIFNFLDSMNSQLDRQENTLHVENSSSNLEVKIILDAGNQPGNSSSKRDQEKDTTSNKKGDPNKRDPRNEINNTSSTQKKRNYGSDDISENSDNSSFSGKNQEENTTSSKKGNPNKRDPRNEINNTSPGQNDRQKNIHSNYNKSTDVDSESSLLHRIKSAGMKLFSTIFFLFIGIQLPRSGIIRVVIGVIWLWGTLNFVSTEAVLLEAVVPLVAVVIPFPLLGPWVLGIGLLFLSLSPAPLTAYLVFTVGLVLSITYYIFVRGNSALDPYASN